MEEVNFRLYVRLACWIQRLLSIKTRERIEKLLLLMAAHLLVLLFVLHNSFISDGSRVSCFEQFPLTLKISGNLEGDRLQLLRIQILPDAEQADWGLSTGPVNSYLMGTLFIYASQKSLLALLEYPEALQPDVMMDTLYLPMDSQCFKLRWFNELPLWRWIRDRVIGYDTIVENQLLKHVGVKGVLMREDNCAVVDMTYGVFNPASQRKVYWFKFLVLKIKTLHVILFLFLVLTALVAFVLMETQKRVLLFATLFYNRQQLRIPVTNLISTFLSQLLVFVPVLLGILFFLFELYKDHLLAIGVMTIMWVGESFSVVIVRTRLSQRFFPLLFFCLFTFFHIYIFSFPFGFSYVALGTTSVLLLQLILFFWNYFEIPALNRGEISTMCPREQLF
eukprot:jgi/Phyca11/547573/estExt2_Genewise1Plus.C_PHYCAscaffold_250296